MEEVIIKLKEAAEIKETIARKESLMWQRVSEALDLYVKYQQKPREQKQSSSNYSSNTYLNTPEAAKHLGLSVGTLHGWRFYGTGPKYIKMGRSVRYRIEDLNNFAVTNEAAHTSSYPSKKGSFYSKERSLK